MSIINFVEKLDSGLHFYYSNEEHFEAVEKLLRSFSHEIGDWDANDACVPRMFELLSISSGSAQALTLALCLLMALTCFHTAMGKTGVIRIRIAAVDCTCLLLEGK